MPYNHLFISLNDEHKEGHTKDLRSYFKEALANIPHLIFQETPKQPENIFCTTVEEILLCKGALFDALPSENSSSLSRINPDILIQFGICYALKREAAFLFIKHNLPGLPQVPSQIINNYLYFDNYSDMLAKLEPKILDLLDATRTQRHFERNKYYSHSFTVFGADQDDLRKTIIDFASGTNWKHHFPALTDNVSGTTYLLSELEHSITLRPFSIFCLNWDSDDIIYTGIGIAIGKGVPFLLLQQDKVELPDSLRGYNGIIKYKSYIELNEGLQKYTSKFLSEDVQLWNGSTFYHLLSKTENQLKLASTEVDFDRIEKVLTATAASVRPALSQPYMLLGELYREKHTRLNPPNNDLLNTAIEYYSLALEISPENKRCQDSIIALDKHIQLINLINEHNYRSIPSLIRLIGEDLKTEYYVQLREYLISVVRKLISKNDYLHALSLLVAIKTHDKSDDVEALIKDIFEAASPDDLVKALQETQSQVILLEENISLLIKEALEKDDQLSEVLQELTTIKENFLQEKKIQSLQFSAAQEFILEANKKIKKLESELDKVQKMNSELANEVINKNNQLEVFTKRLAFNQSQLSKANLRFSDLQEERVRLNSEILKLENELATSQSQLSNFFGQLQEAQERNQKLKEEVLNDSQSLQNRIEKVRQSPRRDILVNFGFGWAVYSTLPDNIFIIRNGQRFQAKEGFAFSAWDRVIDSQGSIVFGLVNFNWDLI